MLSKTERTFLRWLTKQPRPLRPDEMANLNAPEFSSQRVDRLHKVGCLDAHMVMDSHLEHAWAYSISEEGRAALEECDRQTELSKSLKELENLRTIAEAAAGQAEQAEAEASRAKVISTISIIASLISALAAILSLFLGH